MKQNTMYLGVFILLLLSIGCSNIDNSTGILDPVEDMVNLNRSAILFPNAILALDPTEDIKFEIVSKTDQRVVMSIRGIEKFVITESGDYENLNIYSGDIRRILVEQDIAGQVVGAFRLLEIEGDYSLRDTQGTTPEQWYQVLLSKESALLGGSGECEDDEDCEKILDPRPPYTRVCTQGTCNYVL